MQMEKMMITTGEMNRQLRKGGNIHSIPTQLKNNTAQHDISTLIPVSIRYQQAGLLSERT